MLLDEQKLNLTFLSFTILREFLKVLSFEKYQMKITEYLG